MNNSENKGQDEGEEGTKYKAPDYRQIAKDFLTDNNKCPLRTVGPKTFTYTGTHYREVPDLDRSFRDWLEKVGRKATKKLCSEVLPEVKRMSACDKAGEVSMPFWKNPRPSDPHPTRVIAFRNGLLDVDRYLEGRDDALSSHDFRWISTSCLPFDFSPSAVCPGWIRYMEDALEGDADRIACLQEWAGYCLTPDNSRQRFMVTKGPSGSGKSVFAEVLEQMVGVSNSTAFDIGDFGTRFGPAKLFGKSLAIIGEADVSGRSDKVMIVGKLKNVTGNDPVSLEWKNVRDMPSVRLHSRFHICCNSFPVLPDSTNALDRRMLVVPFNRQVLDPDPTFVQKLLPELPGIAMWALEGLRRLNANDKFTESALGRQEIASISRDNNHTLSFLQERVRVYEACNPGRLMGVEISQSPQEVFAKVLNKAYEEWCVDHNVQGSPTWLTRNIKNLIPKLGTPANKVSTPFGERDRKIVGIGLKPYDS